MRLLTALGLTAALLFAGCGGAGTAPTITAPVTHVIKGSVKVFDFNVGYDLTAPSAFFSIHVMTTSMPVRL
jgi:hypothetical protein